MASQRSRSPSTPSEGEIIESGSETKATTSQTPLNGTSVDRHTRASPPSARSPAVLSGSPHRRKSRSRSRPRTRSRSPYRDYRGSKRRRDDDYDDRRYRDEPPRRFASRHEDRYYDRDQRRPRSYYDYDRGDGYSGGLKYSDDYDRRRDKRPRTRSRSPYREVRKPKQYSGDEWESTREERSVSRDIRRRRSPTEQLVSERGGTPGVAPHSKPNAETRETQVQQATSDVNTRVANDRYGLFVCQTGFEVAANGSVQVGGATARGGG